MPNYNRKQKLVISPQCIEYFNDYLRKEALTKMSAGDVSFYKGKFNKIETKRELDKS